MIHKTVISTTRIYLQYQPQLHDIAIIVSRCYGQEYQGGVIATSNRHASGHTSTPEPVQNETAKQVSTSCHLKKRRPHQSLEHFLNCLLLFESFIQTLQQFNVHLLYRLLNTNSTNRWLVVANICKAKCIFSFTDISYALLVSNYFNTISTIYSLMARTLSLKCHSSKHIALRSQ